MIDSDQSHPLHLRKIPRTIGDVPDGPLFIPKTIMMASPRVRARSSMQCVNEPRNRHQLKRFEDGNERELEAAGGWGRMPQEHGPMTFQRLTCGVAAGGMGSDRNGGS